MCEGTEVTMCSIFPPSYTESSDRCGVGFEPYYACRVVYSYFMNLFLKLIIPLIHWINISVELKKFDFSCDSLTLSI